jgi:hypothetical protein
MKRVYLVLFAITLTVALHAQDFPPEQPKPKPKEEQQQAQKKPSILDRMSLGGYLGAQFGTVTSIDISPMLIFEVTPSFYTGLGLTYMFYKDKYYNYTSNSFGGSILARYHVWKDLFAQVEYDPLNLNYYDSYYDNNGKLVKGPKTSVWIHDLLIGAGYRQWMGEKSFATIAIFYNVNETPYSPNRNPIIRIGFGFGL